MKKLLLWSISVLCMSQIGLATTKNTVIPPVYLRNNVVDSIYLPDIIHDDDYDDYSIKGNKYLQMRYDKMTRMIYVKPSIEEMGTSSITITNNDIGLYIPVFIKRTVQHTFKIFPKIENSKAYLGGTFNSWSPTTLPMIPDQNGIPSLTLHLEPGRYFYKYVLNGEIVTDENSPVISDGKGGEVNMLNIVPSTYAVSLHPLSYSSNNDGTLTVNFIASGVSTLKADDVVAFYDNTLISTDRIRTNENQFSLIISPLNITRINGVIRVGINTPSGSSSLYTLPLQDTIQTHLAQDNNHNGIISIYSVLIDRFHDGSGSNNETKTPDSVIPFVRYKGGDFAGITKKIKDGYFSSLNITTLLLSPVADNPDTPFLTTLTAPSKSTAYLGLWPVHHEKVENHFGTMEELQTLIDEAHKRGISVILDYIADQVHKDHPYVKNHPEWFLPYRGGDDFVKVIDFNSYPEAIESVTDNIIWWIKNTKADGVKVDNAGTINEQFRRVLSRKIHKLEEDVNKDIIIIGHTRDVSYTTPTIVSEGQMSAVLNSTLYESMYSTALEKESIEGLGYALSSDKICDQCLNYIDEPTGYYHPKIPDKRTLDFISLPTTRQKDSVINLKRKFKSLPIFHLLTHTLPGIPIIHTGEELGYSATISSTHNSTLYFNNELFNEEKASLEALKLITSLRSKNSAIKYGIFNLLYILGDYMVYMKSDFTQKILIAINHSDKESELSCIIPNQYKAKQLVDLLDIDNPEKNISVLDNSIVRFRVESKGFRVFLVK